MTTTLKFEEFPAKPGITLFVEQYADKDRKRAYWRYGYIIDWKGLRYHRILNDWLTSRPNKKRLAERY